MCPVLSHFVCGAGKRPASSVFEICKQRFCVNLSQVLSLPWQVCGGALLSGRCGSILQDGFAMTYSVEGIVVRQRTICLCSAASLPRC